MGEQYLLEMKGISKSFPGVKALDNVNLQLRAGEVHALLGENGAGKSTLIKVLGGIYHAEEGEIYIEGQKVDIDGVVSSRSAGVSIVHQELVLVPYMTVAENIFPGQGDGQQDEHQTQADDGGGAEASGYLRDEHRCRYVG